LKRCEGGFEITGSGETDENETLQLRGPSSHTNRMSFRSGGTSNRAPYEILYFVSEICKVLKRYGFEPYELSGFYIDKSGASSFRNVVIPDEIDTSIKVNNEIRCKFPNIRLVSLDPNQKRFNLLSYTQCDLFTRLITKLETMVYKDGGFYQGFYYNRDIIFRNLSSTRVLIEVEHIVAAQDEDDQESFDMKSLLGFCFISQDGRIDMFQTFLEKRGYGRLMLELLKEEGWNPYPIGPYVGDSEGFWSKMCDGWV
jgi:hypothetical protein